jgi:putative ABC transport system substrate-binding protein
MINRRTFLVSLGATPLIGALPFRSIAQQSGKIPRIGVLGVTSAIGYAPQVEAMRQGFRNLVYVEGKSIVIEYRWAEGRRDRLPALAAELIALQPDVLITSGAGTRVLNEATATVPIVMAAGADAVANGLIASLAQPGGNITGSTFFGPELLAKRLEMLKEAVPRLARAAVLVNPDSGDNLVNLAVLNKTAAALNIELREVPARSPNEFEEAFALILRRRAGGLVVPDDSMYVANMRRLGELSAAKQLPGAGSDEYAEGGGLLVYGVDFPDLWRRAPLFVDKILKGVKPGTIPVERATRFAMVINLKTAKIQRLTIPQSLLVRADGVIK